jgi:hypothetical protein
MSERNFESIPVLVEYLCDECKQGYMQQDTDVKPDWQSSTPYPHKCMECGQRQSFRSCYPIMGMRHHTPPKELP